MLNTKHKKKSAVITTFIISLILVVIFNVGMQYLDPPDEYGLAINLGDSNFGAGEPVSKATTNLTPKKIDNVPDTQEVVSEQKNQDKVLTQDLKDAPIVDASDKNKPEKLKTNAKKKPIQKVTPKEKKPSKETQTLLNNLLKGNSKEADSKGEGTDKDQGVKGSKEGELSSKYYQNKGSGGDKNYNLTGRNVLSRPIEKPNCNEEGIVVVAIEVDNLGKVIKAVPGVKGSTNTAKCLLDPAKLAALKTTWNLDPKAPKKQRGTIIYRFSLSE